MFGLSFTELLVVAVVALLVFGPEQLPELARSVGKMLAKLRFESDQARRQFYNTIYVPADEVKKNSKSITEELTAVVTNKKEK